MRTEACGHAAALRLAAGLLGGLLLAAWPAFATEQPAGPHYQVELVIFQQPAGSSVELPPLPRQEPVSPAEQVPEPDDDSAPPQEVLHPEAEAGDDEFLPPGFGRPLLPLSLDAVAARLNRGGYQLLWHQAWVQPPLERDGVELAWLAALGQGPATAGLEGTVVLAAGRYLHLGLDLELHTARGLEAELRQRRRIRAAVDQYFDHPMIGVVALVRPVEISPDQPPDSTESTP